MVGAPLNVHLGMEFGTAVRHSPIPIITHHPEHLSSKCCLCRVSKIVSKTCRPNIQPDMLVTCGLS